MGKLSAALERHQQEKTIKAKPLSTEGPQPDTVVMNRLDPRLVVCSAPGSLEAENFKVLKSQILFPKQGSNPRVVMVTSALPGEGKTFVAANLAVSLAQGVHEHALLMDCDFHHPNIHHMLGYANKAGLQEYLTGKAQLSELLIRTGIEKLSLLTAGVSVPDPSELLTSATMKGLFEELKGRYPDRYIIVDSAPSHLMAEVSVLSNYVDGIIFVIKAGRAPRRIIDDAIERLGKEKIFGIVFNGYDKATKSYDSYYSKYYKKSNVGR